MAEHAADICIIGAGPVGGVLACLLAEAGRSVAIVDRAALPPMEHPDFDGRAYAIAAGSRAVLERAGIWDALRYPAGPIRDIRVSDGRVGRSASPLFLHFDSGEIGREALGWMVEARSLRLAVNTRLNGCDAIQVWAPAEARVERTPGAAIVHLGSGERITCRLMVAADGRDSAVRRAAGIPVTRLSYGQTALVGAIAHERPHQGTALEHFLPAGPFAQLPMAASPAAENLSAYVWTEREADARRLLALDDAAFASELGRRLGPHLGAIRVLGRRWHYELGALHAHRYTAPRLALVGDAAHGIHPIAGQGLNLGIRDVAALADSLAVVDDPGDPAALRRYQAARRPDNLAMLAATDLLDRLFSNDARPVRLVRDLGIAAVHRLPALKRIFMRRAMGVLVG